MYKVITSPGVSDVEAKKSHFICELKTVRNEEEAKEFLEEVRKEHREARHHCFALRIGEPGTEYERFSDDGEPQGTAGKPILSLLQGAELYDCIAVVTRYFGGTLLGTGGLVRAYSDSVKEALAESEINELIKGVRVKITSDYQTANRIKYLAGTMGIFTEKEEYTDTCGFYYLIKEELYETFISKITEMSGGRIVPSMKTGVYYYEKTSPVVYKER